MRHTPNDHFHSTACPGSDGLAFVGQGAALFGNLDFDLATKWGRFLVPEEHALALHFSESDPLELQEAIEGLLVGCRRRSQRSSDASQQRRAERSPRPEHNDAVTRERVSEEDS